MPISIVAPMDGSVSLDGTALTPEAVTAIARDGAAVAIAPSASERMHASAAVVARAAEADVPVYGLTTGLGPRVVERVDGHAAAAFSLQTLRGRAMSVGERLPAEVSRAAMAVRCNGFCAGGSGATPAIADGLAALLNARVHPSIPRFGSVGAIVSSPVVDKGVVYFGSMDGNLYALQ